MECIWWWDGENKDQDETIEKANTTDAVDVESSDMEVPETGTSSSDGEN